MRHYTSIRRITGQRQIEKEAIGNAQVKILHHGAIIAEKSTLDRPLRNLPLAPVGLVPKSETPFRDFWWDRYEREKPASAR